MRIKRGIFAILILALSINIVSASFELGNLSHSIEKSYAPGDKIKGWVNLSLKDEPVNSAFESSLGGSFSLVDLINNTNFKKSCIPTDCNVKYTSNNGEAMKTADIAAGDKKIFGLSVQGIITNINLINFSFESNAPSSCENQIEIDFFDDKKVDIGNYKPLSEGCSNFRSYGCFDSAKTTTLISVDNTPKKYCQKIILSKSPGFKIGAWVKKESGKKNITMALYDASSRNPINNANCRLPDASTSGEEVSCQINFTTNEQKNYYVCIYSESSGTGVYKIKGYLDSQNGCGFYDMGSEISAYDIFAEGLKYNNVGNLIINNTLPNGENLAQKIKDYIWRKYGSFDCSNECVIPLSIKANTAQQIKIKDLRVVYDTNLGPGLETNSFYDIAAVPAIINSGFQKIDLEQMNFSVPLDYGNSTLELKLNTDELFSEKIAVEKVPLIGDLNRLTTVAGLPTEFEISVSTSNANISRYYWEFGDNQSVTTTTNKVTHAYNSTGDYKLKVTVTDLNQLNSSKIFNINVNSPKEFVNTTIIGLKTRISDLRTKLLTYPEFYKTSMESVLKIEEKSKNLTDLEKSYKQATTEADYIELVQKITSLNIPIDIVEKRNANSIIFSPLKEDIDLDALKSASGSNYDSSKANLYKGGIFEWDLENIDVKINYKEFALKNENEEAPFISFFEVIANEKKQISYTPYLLIKKLENIGFKENYQEREISDYYSINLKDKNSIEFYTTGIEDFSNVPLFVSPSFSYIQVSTISPPAPKEFNWTLFIVISILLLMMGFFVYLGMQLWYKNKYEKYLFPNRNDLLNLVLYIDNARNKGINEREIENKLKKSGWKSEQVSYAMRKYFGKKTGMLLEIPIEKIIGIFKKKSDLNKINPSNQRRF
jgi:PKD repeat protein